MIDRLTKENQNTRAGFHDEENRAYTVRGLGEFLNPKDILDTVVKRDGDKTIRIRDFEIVVDGFQRTDSLVRISGNLSNAFGVIRKSVSYTHLTIPTKA